MSHPEKSTTHGPSHAVPAGRAGSAVRTEQYADVVVLDQGRALSARRRRGPNGRECGSSTGSGPTGATGVGRRRADVRFGSAVADGAGPGWQGGEVRTATGPSREAEAVRAAAMSCHPAGAVRATARTVRPGAEPGRRPIQGRAGGVRLTRRGRLTARVLLLLTATVTVVGVAAATRADDTPPSPPRTVMVQEGDTLWNLATRYAPERPPRETVAEIRRLNSLSGSTVRVGERIVLPSR